MPPVNDPQDDSCLASSLDDGPITLAEFLERLPAVHPESRLALTEPAQDFNAAVERLDEIIRHYSEIYRCEEDLRRQRECMQHMSRLSDILGIDPDQVRGITEESLQKGFAIASGAALIALLFTGSEAGEWVEALTHILDGTDLTDLTDFLVLPGIAIGLWLIRKYLRGKASEKLKEVHRLTEVAFCQGLLARSLMVPGRGSLTLDCLERLNQLGVSVTGVGTSA